MMADDKPLDTAAAMFANALIANCCGSRAKATERAAKAFDKQTEAEGQLVWMKAYHMLRSGNPIPPHRTHIPEIPNPHDLRYVRVECFASGGAVGGHDDDDGGNDDRKASKEQANYSPYGDEEKHCSICRMWVAAKGNDHHGRCTAVAGSIAPTAICDFYEDKKVHYERIPIKQRDNA
jgi:hypothetical protein